MSLPWVLVGAVLALSLLAIGIAVGVWNERIRQAIYGDRW